MRIRFSPMLATGIRTMVPTLILFSVFLLVVGHDLPGGGFAAALMASLAIILVFLAYGTRAVVRLLPAEPETLTGVGLGMALLGGIVGWLMEGTFLAAAFRTVSLPGFGEVKLSSLLIFELGVFLLVVGLIATATVHLGAEQAE